MLLGGDYLHDAKELNDMPLMAVNDDN
jgi:hypothetical protein